MESKAIEALAREHGLVLARSRDGTAWLDPATLAFGQACYALALTRLREPTPEMVRMMEVLQCRHGMCAANRFCSASEHNDLPKDCSARARRAITALVEAAEVTNAQPK